MLHKHRQRGAPYCGNRSRACRSTARDAHYGQYQHQIITFTLMVITRLCRVNSEHVDRKRSGSERAESACADLGKRHDGETLASVQKLEADRIYSYQDAIDLAGKGWYSAGLLAVLSVATLAMGIDMFGFSVIVSSSACEFQLDLNQTSILLSVPFLGPIAMSYWWGYVSDRRGRRASLLVALWGSFLVAAAGSLAPNWILMALLKFISTSLCSCAQSGAYTLLGESCPRRSRDAYMLVMSSVLDFSLAAYIGIAYFTLKFEFSYDLGLIRFTPWRLLALALALPLGVAAFGLHFFYESPKFLLNAARPNEALENLKGIWRKNGCKQGKYPVNKIYLEEEGNERCKDSSFLQSLWEQLKPLFKPPLLIRSFQLYFLTAVVYGTNNSYFIWFPFLAEKFGSSLTSSADSQFRGMCELIVTEGRNFTHPTSCPSHMEISLMWSSLAQGTVFVVALLIISKVAHKRKLLMITILMTSCVSSVGAVIISDHVISFIMFFGLLLNELSIGFIFSYFIDLYPTSYRGTAASLGVLVARASALGCVNILGAYITSQCALTFYGSSVLLFCACVVAAFLPPDKY